MLNRLTFLFKKILFKIIPIHKDRIVFMSYNGHYTDSPRYVFENMKQLGLKELIWLVDKKYLNDVPIDAKKYDINSFKGLYYFASANVIIDNVLGNKECYLESDSFFAKFKFKIFTFLNKKKNQYVYTLWHGTPIKKMGRDLKDNSVYDFSCPNTTMLCPDKYTKDILSNLCFNKINTELFGSPRREKLKNYDIDVIKDKLNIPRDKKIVLFAPTFRTDSNLMEKNVDRSGINQINLINFNYLFETLSKKFGGDWIFICRFHYHVSQMVNWDLLNESFGRKIINGNLIDDMNEYLAISDVLISDISSCFFDYSYLYRPAFSFFPDYTYYKDTERGFYLDVETLPFPLATTFNELINNINDFDFDKYKNDIDLLNDKMGFCESADTINKITNYIIKERNLNGENN